MKRIIFLAVLCVMMSTTKVKADVKEMKATAYCLQGQTAKGTDTKYGICAGKREWLGKQVSVYTKYGNYYLGTYIVEDTGGEAVKNGEVLDLWFPDKELCNRFGCVDIIAIFED